MSRFEKLIELNKDFDHCLVNEWLNSVWYIDLESGSIHWNGQGNLQDLYNGDGDTYSAELARNSLVFHGDGYMLAELTDDRGGCSFSLFKDINEVASQ